MVIIELLTMKITFDAILDHVNSLGFQQEIHERVRIMKGWLLQLMHDYESGQITKEEFEKKESEILKDIENLLKQLSSQGTNEQTTQSTNNLGGLAGLLG